MKTYTTSLLSAGLLTLVLHTPTFAQPTFDVATLMTLNQDFSDAKNWIQPQYGTTIMFADINGDGNADVCGRGPGGIYCALSTGKGFATANLVQPDFSDANHWNQSVAYYGSIRFADVDGDKKPDICGRGAAGIYCALNTGNGTFASVTLWSAFFSDNSDGDEPEYGQTVMFGDINGDGRADVCARGNQGVYCALNTGNGAFGAQYLAGPEYNDSGIWTPLSNGGTLRLVNADGWLDICARASNGLVCSFNKANGTGAFYAPKSMDQFFADGLLGWGHVRYGSTIMFGDIDHDAQHKADVCGRGVLGIYCAVSTGGAFVNAALVQTQFSDVNGWNTQGYFGSLRLADMNGDGKADICGRGALGIYCAVNQTR